MSRIVRYIILVCLGTGFCMAQDKPDHVVRQQIADATSAVGKAIATSDYAALEHLWSPEMLVNSPGNRVLTRSQVFAAMREDKLKYASHSGEIESFHSFGDLAVEMGHETLVPANGPEAGVTLYRRYTNIWQRKDGAWAQIARQGTYTDEKQVHYAPPK